MARQMVVAIRKNSIRNADTSRSRGEMIDEANDQV